MYFRGVGGPFAGFLLTTKHYVMKTRNLTFFTIVLFAMTIFCSFSAFSAGSISGRILDENSDPLAFANIVISHQIVNGEKVTLRTQIGTTTDLDGYFSLSPVSPGTYMLKIIYVGYKPSELEVIVSNNEDTGIEVQMEHESMDLEEVVVTAQAKGQLSAINQQLAATTVKNVVASDRIQQNPDANATEALGRLPGISVTRSGGEANDIVIRGLAPQYNTVMLNGIELPSNKSVARNANLSGISQYSLQGVEVFKSITPDMNANTVSGAVNMKLRTAPDGFNSNVMVQGGYNAQNNDMGNYKLNASISNRFLDQKFGIDLNVSSEKVNRSTQSLTAGYEITTNSAPEGEYEPMKVTNINLVDVERFNYRSSGSLVFDYRFSPRSSIEFSNFFTYSPVENLTISKNYNPTNASINIGVNDGVENVSYLYSGTILGKHDLGKIEIDYGTSYSLSRSNSERRDFAIGNQEGYPAAITADVREELSLFELIELSDDELTDENLKNFGLGGPGGDFFTDLAEDQMQAHLNFKIPYKILDGLAGWIKFGGQYKFKERNYDQDQRHWGGPTNFYKLISGIQQTPDDIDWSLDWVNLNKYNQVYMADMLGGTKGSFLQGGFDFGWYPDVAVLNEIYQWWQDITGYYTELYKDDPNQDRLLNIFGQPRMIGFFDPKASAKSDNKTRENYYAGYFMTQLNIGKRIIFTPGFRYEKMDNWLEGWWLESRIDEGLNIPGYKQDTTRQNEFLLPMVHLKYKPFNWMNVQLSYTKTINRPNYNYIIPFEYIKDDLDPFIYEAGNPGLKAERWTNYDLSIAFHSNKLGLLALNGFYKTVDDKVWQRIWKRLPGDEIVTSHFPASASYEVNSWYNHEEEVVVQGFEIEWQTNFWYLPKPFSFFTLTTNYSLIDNEASYPISEVEIVQTGVTDRGRPIFEKIRKDSAYSGPMLNQPKQLANISLGFSYKTFDMWLSYQYIGEQWIALGTQEELDQIKVDFTRWGLQGRWEMPLDGLELLFNVSNINDIQEKIFYKGDDRPRFLENYGWTSDIGFRYTF